MTNGIGPKGTSLLTKLGLKNLSEMSEAELRQLVSNDRQYRVTTRAAGRINRIAKDKHIKLKPPQTLESIGLAPSLIAKLRLSGESDQESIAKLKLAGII